MERPLGYPQDSWKILEFLSDVNPLWSHVTILSCTSFELKVWRQYIHACAFCLCARKFWSSEQLSKEWGQKLNEHKSHFWQELFWYLHCLLYGRYGITPTMLRAEEVLHAYAMISSSIMLLFTSLKIKMMISVSFEKIMSRLSLTLIFYLRLCLNKFTNSGFLVELETRIFQRI